ncbi:dihydrofolate reductase [Neisseria weaveri]|uniref:dihydrofolate reductase n=1 Tax=Neisseria weaveri TaxID=28091 RepID=UPI0007C9AC16|nr:dihydrofolate reductase [Neisseria weaveri]SAY50396.1 protein FolA [Neisseria weaveri]
MQKVTLIAAVAKNGCIGINNDMPWHIPEDFAFFKQYTMEKPVIMGRKTWESLPKKPLPGRRNIVISRDADYSAQGAEVVTDIQTALGLCKDEVEVMIMGGAQIYQETITIATDLRITKVDLMVEGDAFFPEIDSDIWEVISCEKGISSKNGMGYAFVHYVRK